MPLCIYNVSSIIVLDSAERRPLGKDKPVSEGLSCSIFLLRSLSGSRRGATESHPELVQKSGVVPVQKRVTNNKRKEATCISTAEIRR